MKKLISSNIIVLIGLAIFLTSCQGDAPVPKPRTYPKIIFPERNLSTVILPECPFAFDFPTYAEVDREQTFFDEAPPNDCWFNLHIPAFNADIYMSYHPVDSRNSFDKLIRDTYKITNQINRRSDYMDETLIKNQYGAGGMIFTFEGAAASPMQFYLSDTTNHFLKGALYYNSKVRPDSLMPATEFIMEDIHGMLATFRWKK